MFRFDFLIFLFFFGLGGAEERCFSNFFTLWIFFFFFFHFLFICFLICFSMFFLVFLFTFGPHHFKPTPLLAQALFFVKPFCAQTFANHPWPKKTLANGAALRDNSLLMSCSLGHGQNFTLVRPKFGRSHDSHPPDPLSPTSPPSIFFLSSLPGLHTTAREPKCAHFRAQQKKKKNPRKDPQEREERKLWRETEKKARNFGPPPFGARGPSAGPPSAGQPTISPFFPSPASILAFFSLWGSSHGIFGGVGNVGACLKSRWLLQSVKNNFTLICPPIRLPKKSMTNYCKFCLYPEQKPRTQPNEIPREDAPHPFSGPTPLGPHCSWVVVCAVCAALLLLVAAFLVACDPVAACCCRCFCCCLCLLLLLGRRPSNPSLPTFAVFDRPKCY